MVTSKNHQSTELHSRHFADALQPIVLSDHQLGIVSRGQGVVNADVTNKLNPAIKLGYFACLYSLLKHCAYDLHFQQTGGGSLLEDVMGWVAMDQDRAQPIFKKETDAVAILDGPHDLYHLYSFPSPHSR